MLKVVRSVTRTRKHCHFLALFSFSFFTGTFCRTRWCHSLSFALLLNLSEWIRTRKHSTNNFSLTLSCHPMNLGGNEKGRQKTNTHDGIPAKVFSFLLLLHIVFCERECRVYCRTLICFSPSDLRVNQPTKKKPLTCFTNYKIGNPNHSLPPPPPPPPPPSSSSHGLGIHISHLLHNTQNVYLFSRNFILPSIHLVECPRHPEVVILPLPQQFARCNEVMFHL